MRAFRIFENSPITILLLDNDHDSPGVTTMRHRLSRVLLVSLALLALLEILNLGYDASLVLTNESNQEKKEQSALKMSNNNKMQEINILLPQ